MLPISSTAVRLTVGFRYSSIYSSKTLLSNENIIKTIAKLKALKPIRLQTHEPVKRAAVFIPICVANHQVSLLYIVKPTILTQHKERVNFPGGIRQTQDQTLVHTVVRRSNELLGISPKRIKIWGTGNLIVARAEFSFIPVIGEILGVINPTTFSNNSEVDEVVTVPIIELCDNKMNSYTQFRDEYATPAFMGDKWRIWGFTAMLTNMFLKSLLPEHGYIHPMKYVPSIKKGTPFPRT